jgi:hypothetical protein
MKDDSIGSKIRSALKNLEKTELYVPPSEAGRKVYEALRRRWKELDDVAWNDILDVIESSGRSKSRAIMLPYMDATTDSPAGNEIEIPVPSSEKPSRGPVPRKFLIERRMGRTRPIPIPLPPNWIPLEKHFSRASELGLDCISEAEKFRAHSEKTGNMWASWDAAFTGWLLKAHEISMERKFNKMNSQSPPRKINRIG